MCCSIIVEIILFAERERERERWQTCTAWTLHALGGSFNINLISAEAKKLECFRLTANYIFIIPLKSVKPIKL